MTEQQTAAANNLWSEFRQWLKDNGLGHNITVNETSPNRLQIKAQNGPELHIEFALANGLPLNYRFDDNSGNQLQIQVTIRGQAYFDSNGERYAARDLGQKLLDELVLRNGAKKITVAKDKRGP